MRYKYLWSHYSRKTTLWEYPPARKNGYFFCIPDMGSRNCRQNAGYRPDVLTAYQPETLHDSLWLLKPSDPLQSRAHYGQKQVHLRINEDIATFCKRTVNRNAPHPQMGCNQNLRYHYQGNSPENNLCLIDKGCFFKPCRPGIDFLTLSCYFMLIF